MEDKLYWVWLSLLFPCGSNKPAQILAWGGSDDSPKKLYQAVREGVESSDSSKSRINRIDTELPFFLTENERRAACCTGLERAHRILEDCERLSISIVTMGEPLYPKRLKAIYGPPPVLYVMGDISGLDDEVVITMVGTRRETEYSNSVTGYLAKSLAQAGAVVVSGCAVGIDAAAHVGALQGGGRTVGVLGCGLDIDYPAENRRLKQKILEKGALISELPPGTGVTSKIFPIRNRIMAGLALGVTVTHAPVRSGSLITAEHALENGRDVFCVPPYSLFDPAFYGVVKYLRDGAIPVFCADDILAPYLEHYAEQLDLSKITGDYVRRKVSSPSNRGKPASSVRKATAKETEKETPEEREELKKKLLKFVSEFDDAHLLVYNKLDFALKFVDELVEETGLGVGETLSILTEFEIMGIVSSSGGQRYALSQK